MLFFFWSEYNIKGGDRLQKEKDVKLIKNVDILRGINSDGVVVPPGCENEMLYECGENVTTFVPKSYKPYVATNHRAIPHPMNGTFKTVSVPKTNALSEKKSIAEYLVKFKNANLCLDLWIKHSYRIKKCGVLIDVGDNFIILKENGPDKISIIDLDPVYYINIYCKSNL